MDIANLNPGDFRKHILKRFKNIRTAEQFFEGIFRNISAHKLSFKDFNSVEQILQNLKRLRAVPSGFSEDDLLSVARSFDFRVRDFNGLKKLLSQGEAKKYTVLDAEKDLRAKVLCPYRLRDPSQTRFYLEIPGQQASRAISLVDDDSIHSYDSDFKKVLGMDLQSFLEASNFFHERDLDKTEVLNDLFNNPLAHRSRMLEQFKSRPGNYLENLEIGFFLSESGSREKTTRTVAEILVDFFEERFPSDQSFRATVDLNFINYLNGRLDFLVKQGKIDKFYLESPAELMRTYDNADLLLNLIMDYFWDEKKPDIPGSTKDQIDLNNHASGESLS